MNTRGLFLSASVDNLRYNNRQKVCKDCVRSCYAGSELDLAQRESGDHPNTRHFKDVRTATAVKTRYKFSHLREATMN